MKKISLREEIDQILNNVPPAFISDKLVNLFKKYAREMVGEKIEDNLGFNSRDLACDGYNQAITDILQRIKHD